MIIEALVPPILLFVPGFFLFDIPWLRGAIKLVGAEKVVLGAVLWSTFFVVTSYFVAIFSDLAVSYFGLFAALSVALIAWGVFTHVRRGIGISPLTAEETVLGALIFGLAALAFSLVLAHQTFLEYDAIFYYLPLAKSILLTGGLQTDFFHQSVVPTTIEPALPLMYAFAGFVTNDSARIDSAARLIPFAYLMLTSGAVYLTARTLLRSAAAGLTAAAVFLAFPVTSTMGSNFSLYLDIPFVFYIAAIMYATTKACTSREDGNRRWMLLGVVVASGLFERDILLFLIPSLVGVAAAVYFRRGGSIAWWKGAGYSVVFAGAYNFFFLYDLKFSTLTPADVVVRELPVLAVMAGFALLSGAKLPALPRPPARTFALAGVTLVPFGFVLWRNALSSGVVTSNFVLPSSSLEQALRLVAYAGRPSATVTSLSQLFGWQPLFTGMQGAGIFLVPVALGAVALVVLLLKGDETEKVGSMVVLSSFLAVLLLWSWVFGSGYQGPELRRLDYFAPVLAVFAAAGIAFLGKKLGVESWGVRSAAYVAAVAGLFWYTQVGSTWTVGHASFALDRLGALTPFTFLLFTAPLVIAFVSVSDGSRGPDVAGRRRNQELGVLVAAVAVVAVVGFFALNSTPLVRDAPATQFAVPPGWENGLYPVAQYLNQYQYNTYAVITTYSLPLAYLTPHPVVDSTTYYGVERLIALNSTGGDWSQQLLGGGIRYILLPTQGNNFYDYSARLGDNLTIVNLSHIESSPDVVVLKTFPYYTLFELVPAANSTTQYAYVSSFSSGWSPVDNSSATRVLATGVAVDGGVEVNSTIAGGDPAGFWSSAQAVPTDIIEVSDGPIPTPGGEASLSVYLDGTGNMVIHHSYATSQDWSRYAFMAFYFDGDNTSKGVTLTFHTTEWKDYYAYAFRDNFTGWREFLLPLGSFSTHGTPSWGSITYTEILMGDRHAVYMMGGFTLGGHLLGMEAAIPQLQLGGTSANVVVSVDASATAGTYKPYLLISSPAGDFSAPLKNGVNVVPVPASVLGDGARVEVFIPSFDPSDTFVLFYFGVLSP